MRREQRQEQQNNPLAPEEDYALALLDLAYRYPEYAVTPKP